MIVWMRLETKINKSQGHEMEHMKWSPFTEVASLLLLQKKYIQ